MTIIVIFLVLCRCGWRLVDGGGRGGGGARDGVPIRIAPVRWSSFVILLCVQWSAGGVAALSRFGANCSVAARRDRASGRTSAHARHRARPENRHCLAHPVARAPLPLRMCISPTLRARRSGDCDGINLSINPVKRSLLSARRAAWQNKRSSSDFLRFYGPRPGGLPLDGV